MRCQPGCRTLWISLSVALKCDLTAKLIDALRAARVDALCPSKAAVRASTYPTASKRRSCRRWASPRRSSRMGAFARGQASAPHPPLTRSPFPSRGRQIRGRNWSGCSNGGRETFRYQLNYSYKSQRFAKGRLLRQPCTSSTANAVPLPLEGKADTRGLKRA